jgi:hypothetical protein
MGNDEKVYLFFLGLKSFGFSDFASASNSQDHESITKKLCADFFL